MKERIRSIDTARGMIMILMALDHFIYFLNRYHPAEFWILPPPVFPSPAYAVFRWLSHLCAPGFLFLAGTSLVLFASRKAEDSWGDGKIRLALAARGVILLVVVQLVLEQLAWMLGDLGGRGVGLNPVSYPGLVFSQPLGYLGVIYALAVSIIIGALIYRLPRVVLWILAALSVIASPVALSFIVSAREPIGPVLNALLVPGISTFFTNYPLFPWFGVFLLGVLFGRSVRDRGRDAIRQVWLPALLSLGVGLAVRWLHPWGEFHRFDPARWWSWFELSKYPPSPAFLGITLGLFGMLLWLLERMESRWPENRVGMALRLYGREPLFFYLLHLFAYGALCLVLVLAPRPIVTLAGWIVSLVVFAPIVYGFHRLKARGRLPLPLRWL